MAFNRKFSYLAFSYRDLPKSSVFQENSLLQIVDCSTDQMVVQESRDSTGKTVGKNRNQDLVYDYTFLEWNSDSEVLLKEENRAKNDDSSGAERDEKEVLYSIYDNMFLNPDGSEIKMKEERKEVGGETADKEHSKDDMDRESEPYLKVYQNIMILESSFSLTILLRLL